MFDRNTALAAFAFAALSLPAQAAEPAVPPPAAAEVAPAPMPPPPIVAPAPPPPEVIADPRPPPPIVAPAAPRVDPTPAAVDTPAKDEPAKAPAPEKKSDGVVLTKALKLKLGGQLFASWSADLMGPYPDTKDYDDDMEGANRFDIHRAYLNFEPQIGEKISLRLTPDLTRVKDASKGNSAAGSLVMRVKFAYLQVDDVLPGIRLKVGQQQTAWIEFEDSIWKHRLLGPVGYETFAGMASADTGINVSGQHRAGMIDWQLQVANGEFFAKPESTHLRSAKYKDGTARLTVAPLAAMKDDLTKGIKLTVLHQYGIQENVGPDHAPIRRLRTMGMLTWETKWFACGAGGGMTLDGEETTDDAGDTVVEDRDGLLFSGFAVANLPADFKLLARHDRFDDNLDLSPKDDPDEDGSTGVRTRTIVGVGYEVNPLLYLVADIQSYGYEAPENGDRTDPGTVFFTHLEAKF